MSFRPTDRSGVISGPFFDCVQKIRGNITGYRDGFSSAREEELILPPRDFSLERDVAPRTRFYTAVSFLRLRMNTLLIFFFFLHS